jgi:hypothetical protein
MLDSLGVAAFPRGLKAPRRHRPEIGIRYTGAFSLLSMMASSALGNDINVWSQRKDHFYGFPGG